MNPAPHFLLIAMLGVAVLSACDQRRPAVPPAQSDSLSNPSSAVPAAGNLHGWLGKWIGVEGTYLELLAKPDGNYRVIVKDLDGERNFEGVGGADHIDFERDGTLEKIRTTDGAGTGMKWLAEKSTCLTIRPGEGYCRE